MSDSDSDDEYLKSKRQKGIRGRRGLKKKSASLPVVNSAPKESHIYSTKVSRCFSHMNAHDYDEELEVAKKDTVECDVEDDLLSERNTRTESTCLLSEAISLSEDEYIKDSQNTPSKSTTAATVLSPSPPPPPSPPSSGGKTSRGGRRNRAIRGKKKLLQSVSNLTKDICSARRLLDETAVLQTSFTSPDGDVCVVDSDEVTVRVQFQGEIRRFGMNSDQSFAVVIEEIAHSEEADFNHVMLVHKDKILRPTDTPTSINLHTADIIMCHINENLNNSLNNTPELDDTNLIELCVQSRSSRQREIIKIHPFQPLRVLMEEYSRRVGTASSSLQFWFDGDVVSPTETPDSLEMEDGECLDVNYLTEIVLD